MSSSQRRRSRRRRGRHTIHPRRPAVCRVHAAAGPLVVLAFISGAFSSSAALAAAPVAPPVAAPLPIVPIETHVVAPVETPAANIYDLDKQLRGIPELAQFFTNIDTSRVKVFNRINKAEVTEAVPDGAVYSTGVDIDNSGASEQAQTAQSPSLSVTDSHDIENTISHGLNLGVEVSASQRVDFLVAQGGLEEKVSAGFEMSWATSTRDTKTVSYELPPQSVVAPPYTRVHVSGVMQKVKSSGNLIMSGDLVGEVVFRKSCGGDIVVPIGQLLAMTYANGSRIAPAHISPQGDTARFVGESRFSGAIGLHLSIKYDYIPLSASAPPAKSEIRPVLARPTEALPPIQPVVPIQSTIGRPLATLTTNACPGSGFTRTIENLQVSSADLTNYLDYDSLVPGGAAVKDEDHKPHDMWVFAPLGNEQGLFRLLYGRSGLCLATKKSPVWTQNNQIYDVVVEPCKVATGVVELRHVWGLVRTRSAERSTGDLYQLENVGVRSGCAARPYPGAAIPMVISCHPPGAGEISTWHGGPDDAKWQFTVAESTRVDTVRESLRAHSRQWSHNNQVDRGAEGECTSMRPTHSPDRWQYVEFRLCGKKSGTGLLFTLTLKEMQYKWGGPLGAWYYNTRYAQGRAHVELFSEDGTKIKTLMLGGSTTGRTLELSSKIAGLQPGEYRLVVSHVALAGMWWSTTDSSSVSPATFTLDIAV